MNRVERSNNKIKGAIISLPWNELDNIINKLFINYVRYIFLYTTFYRHIKEYVKRGVNDSIHEI